ncbi:M20/M25/M40 family metallo-hydrolase [Candidatus Vidania fulgoroideae]|uniref:M20/M25/M40 family metallo-hydrolase n=1 Tax=Candidatus Vidania fulgoroideorum TaxID=881286 RepID=A0AAX3N8N8_9PROT|nr:M20/M25/M40 family metallo-hydrolase [Candidatus Vidania fulgoroideae]WDR79339.1 M20/M25/M40 family metallo-hydrolase [Candidatus Vidania fulgoroideae]
MIYSILSIINIVTGLKYLYKIAKKIGFSGKIIKKYNIYNLLLFNNPSKKIDILFISHIDVVHEGKMKNWSYFPYYYIKKKKYIVSRGIIDMKGAIMAFFESIKIKSKKRISILVSGDEEGEAKYGSRIVSKYLKHNKYKISLSLVGEPTSNKKVIDVYKTGRRGSSNIVIKLKGKQGHTAYNNGINPLEKIFLFKNIFKKSKKINISIVGIKCGKIISNVTPEKINIFINVRFINIKFFNIFMKNILKILKNTNLKFFIKKISFIKPYITKFKKKKFRNIIKYISKSKQKNYLGGTSDGRFFTFSKNIIEIGLRNKYIHCTNEKCSIRDIKSLNKIYKTIIS